MLKKCTVINGRKSYVEKHFYGPSYFSGFYFCPESPDKCDEGSTLVLWTEIPKSSVQQLHQPRLEKKTKRGKNF
jgi:hypothetical protein